MSDDIKARLAAAIEFSRGHQHFCPVCGESLGPVVQDALAAIEALEGALVLKRHGIRFSGKGLCVPRGTRGEMSDDIKARLRAWLAGEDLVLDETTARDALAAIEALEAELAAARRGTS